MTGKDILIELNALDPRIVMLADQDETQFGAKRKIGSGILLKFGAFAAALILIICSLPFINNLMTGRDFVTDDYTDVISNCDAAVLAQYQGKTERLTHTEYRFEITEMISGELSDTKITVSSSKSSPFSGDNMEKFAETISAEFKEGTEYFLTLSESKKGDLSFFVEQIIPTNALAEASSGSGDFRAFLEKNGITLDATREELIDFFRYIFNTDNPKEVCQHQFGEWTINEFPTDTEPGLRTSVCSICGKRNKESITASEGLEYLLDHETKTGKVKSYGKCTDREVYVPKYVEGCLITHISAYAFQSDYLNTSAIQNILLPDSITTIERYAFYNCNELKALTIPASVTKIGEYAFYNCRSLKSIEVEAGNKYFHSSGNCLIDTQKRTLILGCNNSVIPNDDTISIIGDHAFIYCDKLENVTIPEGVVTIGNQAFAYCSSLNSIVIPDSVTSLGDFVFSKCSRLSYAVLPKGLTVIPKGLFSECSSLSDVVVPESVVAVEVRAFSVCYSLKSVDFLKNVTSIGSYAFNSCSTLKEVTFSSKLTEIGKGAFETCNNITSLDIPGSVSVVSELAFEGCTGLETLTLQNGIKELGASAFSNCFKVGRVVIPGSVEIIGRAAFHGCRSMTSITIPSSVTFIGASAFYECYKLSSITLPNNLTSIEDFTFFDCRALKSITLPANVTSIGKSAFFNCISLTSVTVRGKLTNIGSNAFAHCSKLNRINYSGTKADWNAVVKEEEWDYSSGYYNVSCTDGMIGKE